MPTPVIKNKIVKKTIRRRKPAVLASRRFSDGIKKRVDLDTEVKIPITIGIPIRIIRAKKVFKPAPQKISFLSLFFKKKSKVLAKTVSAVILIAALIVPILSLSAFEAHVINVTATLVNNVPIIAAVAGKDPGGSFCDNPGPTISLAGVPNNYLIIYTTDGSDPKCLNSGLVYNQPFILATSTTVKAISCDQGTASGIVSDDFILGPQFCDDLNASSSPAISDANASTTLDASTTPDLSLDASSTVPDLGTSTPPTDNGTTTADSSATSSLPHFNVLQLGGGGGGFAPVLDNNSDAPGGGSTSSGNATTSTNASTTDATDNSLATTTDVISPGADQAATTTTDVPQTPTVPPPADAAASGDATSSESQDAPPVVELAPSSGEGPDNSVPPTSDTTPTGSGTAANATTTGN